MRTTSVAVMLTRRCNMACTHCSVESHPKLKLQPAEDEVRQRVRALLASGVKAFQFTGGEPLLRQSLLLEVLEMARDAGAACAVFTNGFWGKKPEVAERTFDALRAAGMTRLALSYDRFHAAFQGPEPLLNILEVARRRDWPVRVTITRTADEHDLEALVAPFRGNSHAEVRFYDVQPVGAARNLSDQMRAELAGFCSACSQATITDDGRVIACNGPSYFEVEGSPLWVGKISASKQLGPLLERHGSDPILETIRVEGPLRLKEILGSLPGFEKFPFQEAYGGMCELCLHITRDPSAVAALREHLSGDEQRALQVAHRRLREQIQREAVAGGGFNEHSGPSALMSALLGQDPQAWAGFITRADLDWRRLTERLTEEGLIHLLAERRDDPYLNRWAPQFVWKAGEGHESRIQERRNLLSQALQVAREAGFQARPYAASAILSRGGRRIPPEISLATHKNAVELERLLTARFGPAVRFRIVPEDSPPDLAVEILKDWRARLFRDALGTVWDAHELNRMGLWRVDPRSHATVLAAARVLARDFGLPAPPDGASFFGPDLVERIVRAQMFRDSRHRDNLYLGSALICFDIRSSAQLPRALVKAWLRLGRDLESSIRHDGWRLALIRAREDFRVVRLLSPSR